MFRKRRELRPVCYIRSVDERCFGIRAAESAEDPLPVGGVVEMIINRHLFLYDIRRRREQPSVGRSCRDAPGIHERNGCDLPLTGLRSFAVRKISGRVPYGKAVVGGYVAGPEAGTAKCRPYSGSGKHEIRYTAVLDKFEQNRLTGRVDRQRERSVSGTLSSQDGGSSRNV